MDEQLQEIINEAKKRALKDSEIIEACIKMHSNNEAANRIVAYIVGSIGLIEQQYKNELALKSLEKYVNEQKERIVLNTKTV